MKLADIQKAVKSDPATQFALRPKDFHSEPVIIYVADAERTWNRRSRYTKGFSYMSAKPSKKVLCAVQQRYFDDPKKVSWYPDVLAVRDIVTVEEATKLIRDREEAAQRKREEHDKVMDRGFSVEKALREAGLPSAMLSRASGDLKVHLSIRDAEHLVRKLASLARLKVAE